MTSSQLAMCISQAQQGDREALGQLSTFVRPLIERQVTRYPLTDEDKRDVVQSAMMQVVRKIESFRGQASFTTWLFRVTANEALMLMRSQRRHRTRIVQGIETDDLDELQLGTESGADELSIEQEREEQVRSALSQLPSHYRDVVTAHYHNDLGLHEIAARLSVTESTVRSRLHRARLRLKSLMNVSLEGAEAMAV
jgi:RNA polymerase sigma-70 factor (ECF subfamily)